jgi:hypothetical protein
MTQLESIYGIRPRPGNYWYDKVSGLFGAVGYPAAGFMHAGHDFGALRAGASSGDSQVFINGRRLPQLEVIAWSALLGEPIMPGRYWLDSRGNAGHAGMAVPIVNIFVAAVQNAQRQMGSSGFGGGSSGASGGDRFWSSLLGAGNSNADNTQGYVSVPGYGPVSYGMP